MLGDYEKAAALFHESLELNRRIGDRGMVMAELFNLGLVEIHRNKVDAAEQSFDESAKIAGSGNEDPYGQAMTLLSKSMISLRKGDVPQAWALLQRTRTTFGQAGIEPAKDDEFEIDWLSQELTKING